jgi:prepilin-type N-terminal cleavage/methylation domain-containing protein
MKTNYFTNGYSLIEVLVAVSILLLALVGPMTIAVKGIQGSYYAREQTTALFLAQEGIEAIVAIRNDDMISAIRSGNLNNNWNWVTDTKLDHCFTDDGQGGNNGCNFDVGNAVAGSGFLANLSTPVNCGSASCTLRFQSSANRARYNVSSGQVSKYTRVIELTEDASGDGVLIKSTVTWPATVFQGGMQSVTLYGAVFKIYD